MASSTPRRREGGVAGVIHNLARELARMGHQVDCLFREDILGERSVQKRFDEVRFGWKLSRRILREPDKYSVVNIHAPVGFAYGMMRRAGWRGNSPPYVLTLHGLEERRVHAMKREQRKGRAWHFGWKNRMWHRLYTQPMYRQAIRTADYSIVLNREAWSYVQLRYDLDASRVWHATNGVEERFFQSREYSQSVAPRLLYVGSWLDQRGIYYIAGALKILAERLPGVQLTVAGCHNEAAEVKKYFDASLRERITVIPFVEAARMPEIYAAHDIFLFPSLMEGLPLALLEAMAGGMPVVTTEACGMPDAVADDVNGLLAPPADAGAIIEAVTRLASSAELRQRLGQAAQASMRQHTWDKIARRIERVLMIAARNGRAQ